MAGRETPIAGVCTGRGAELSPLVLLPSSSTQATATPGQDELPSKVT